MARAQWMVLVDGVHFASVVELTADEVALYNSGALGPVRLVPWTPFADAGVRYGDAYDPLGAGPFGAFATPPLDEAERAEARDTVEGEFREARRRELESALLDRGTLDLDPKQSAAVAEATARRDAGLVQVDAAATWWDMPEVVARARAGAPSSVTRLVGEEKTYGERAAELVAEYEAEQARVLAGAVEREAEVAAARAAEAAEEAAALARRRDAFVGVVVVPWAPPKKGDAEPVGGDLAPGLPGALGDESEARR